MVDEETITTRYRNASLRGKIDIILNYYPGFEEMLQGLRELLCINIEADKMQRRRRELGDPGVRIRKSGYADPTADTAVERIMLLDAIETGNLDQEVKNTECPEEYRMEAVTIARMKEDYLVVKACMKILPCEKAHLLENYYACKMNAEMIKGQDYFNPSFYTKIYRIRRQVRDTAEKTLQSKYGRQTWKKKFVRYKEGAELYSMGLSKFQQMAHEAKATYKVDKLVLVSIEKFEKYLETFAEEP